MSRKAIYLLSLPILSNVIVASPDARDTNNDLLPHTFEPLPLGSIKPRGWLLDQLHLMADGLPGHEHDFYPIVTDSRWLGGHTDYNDLNEGLPYWFNGLVPLAYLTDDQRLKDQVWGVAEHVLSHQQEDGWLGPETSPETRNFWGRSPMLLGLSQLAEAEAGTELEGRILDAMHRFVELMHTMLTDGYRGFVQQTDEDVDDRWGRARAADLVLSLQWLYERDPRDRAGRLMECMRMLHEKALDWAEWYTDGMYLKDDLDAIPIEITDRYDPFEHGVNVAMGLKSGAVYRRFTRDEQLASSSLRAVNWTLMYHGTATGSIIGDERISGLSPTRGVELCTVVETMFSLSYLYHALGENSLADQCEMAAFNALPVMTLPDWWAHQYVAQTNQPISHRLDRSPFQNVEEMGQTFGLEPNYPCCTVNHPQGYPKFVSAAFARHGENGIAHALLGPMEAHTSTRNGVHVSIVCETKYPFAQRLVYTVAADGPFDFLVRIPGWSTSTEILVNNSPLSGATPDTRTGMARIRLDEGTTEVVVSFSAGIHVHHRANATVSISYGNILYAIPVPYSMDSQPDRSYPNLPDNVRDYELLPTAPWAYAIDPASVRYNGLNGELPNPLWTLGAPTSVTARVCQIAWDLVNGYASNPPAKGDRACLSEPYDIELVPYGSAKLHMAELPVMD
ncbi:uncharacterized protein ACLA_094060 [Aspergillus clavatus NRRL 1]|uniref:DUF1680 domain protein n=1 Tax=Aspergillus clavatus (strain ATCC 1007 / CBS 513.65 / DSM 816 / NCTC 3887 / NRRL 1 / QM 1276 / 107) TaxID=344612 RepID=A1CFQ8_ASPCL|nr:uncharacterized protein ACLA_094060 [Aspergillus clavatus NRRL 1]EAW11707.1 hypothetical protein ACLA_094060 [Aspergillus clavatus NRRL 1]